MNKPSGDEDGRGTDSQDAIVQFFNWVDDIYTQYLEYGWEQIRSDEPNFYRNFDYILTGVNLTIVDHWRGEGRCEYCMKVHVVNEVYEFDEAGASGWVAALPAIFLPLTLGMAGAERIVCQRLDKCDELPPEEPPPEDSPPGEPPPEDSSFVDTCPETLPDDGWCLFEITYSYTRTETYPGSSVTTSPGETNWEGPSMSFSHTEVGKYREWFKNASGVKRDRSVGTPTTYTTSGSYAGSQSSATEHYVCASNRARYRVGYEAAPLSRDMASYSDQIGKYYIFRTTNTTRIKRNDTIFNPPAYTSADNYSYTNFITGQSSDYGYTYLDASVYPPTWSAYPAYFPKDKVGNAYANSTSSVSLSFSVIAGGCSDFDSLPPPPPPPQPLPPPLPPEEEEDCCMSCSEMKEMLRSLMRWTGADAGKVTLPRSILRPVEKGLLGGFLDWITPDDVEIKSMPEFWLWWIEQYSATQGAWSQEIEINEESQDSAGGGKIVVPNAAEGIMAILTLLTSLNQDLEENLDKRFDQLMRLGVASTLEAHMARQQGMTAAMLADLVVKWTGLKYKEYKVEIPGALSIDAATPKDGVVDSDAEIEAFLKPSMISLKGFRYDDSKDFLDDLQTLLKNSAISAAAVSRAFDAKGDIAKQVKDFVKGYTETSKGHLEKEKNSEDWDNWTEKVERGFIDDGATDGLTQTPYGRPLDQRPRIREIGKTDDL